VRAQTGAAPHRLRFFTGPQSGQDLILRKPVTTLGRALDNDVVLEAGDVSRHHARLEFASGKLRLSDMGSTNGTKINGKPIQSQAVSPGDELSFGTLRMRLLAFDADERQAR
jgi:pSer/pThr/pTyr-binding forkhead associated (FHA) protein